ncbi:hypothetical protein AAFF_G00331830 [Aldrovandia affinis]|uniref:Uncharacterized protein n=1 Tax=Aldrovandia affinis TaxID=143900 RepID=A0AAD7SNH8_9TELE|nr:hypothetical protein AAFF_G00331830 [Aldrovandia affinis]
MAIEIQPTDLPRVHPAPASCEEAFRTTDSKLRTRLSFSISKTTGPRQDSSRPAGANQEATAAAPQDTGHKRISARAQEFPVSQGRSPARLHQAERGAQRHFRQIHPQAIPLTVTLCHVKQEAA